MQGVIRSLLLAAVLFALAHPARGQAVGAFARMGFGARGIAMGNSMVADGLGDASPYYNPALAPYASGQSLEASAALMSFDRELQFLQFATPLEPSAGLAVGLVHAGVSNIDGRDNSGYHTQNYSTDEFAVFLAFGIRLSQRLTAGIGLQLFRSDLLEELAAVNSLGIDAGFTYAATDNLRLGLAVDDLLARYSWDTSTLYGSEGKTTSDRFPIRIRLGASYRLLEGQAQIVAEYESQMTSFEHRIRRVEVIGDRPQEVEESTRYTIQENHARVGAEYVLSDVLTLRAGVDRIGHEMLNGVAPSAGFMVAQPVGPLGLRGEYAFVREPYGTGSMHLITLRIFLE